MEDLLFERLDRLEAEVDPEIVLQDLYFIDRVMRPATGPDDPDYRGPWLFEALQARRLCSGDEACWRAIDLYDDLLDLFEIDSFRSLDRVLERYRDYERSDASAVEER